MKFLNRRIVITFIIGLLVVLLLRALYILADLSITSLEFQNLSPEQVISNSTLHAFTVYDLARSIVSVLSFVTPIIAGFFVAKGLKERGFMNGIIFGLIYFVLVYFLFFVMYLLFRQSQSNSFSSSIPKVFIETVVLTGLGGWLGGRLRKRK